MLETNEYIALMIMIVLIVWIIIYFIPTIIAFRRKHINKISILIINLFLGWSLIGWVIALAWAFKKPER